AVSVPVQAGLMEMQERLSEETYGALRERNRRRVSLSGTQQAYDAPALPREEGEAKAERPGPKVDSAASAEPPPKAARPQDPKPARPYTPESGTDAASEW